jgi:hypothetical protein
MSVEYVSDEPSGVRVGDRPIVKGDVIAGPPEVVAELAERPGFRIIDHGVVEAGDPEE